MRARRADPLSDDLSALDELEDDIRRPKKRSWSLIIPLLMSSGSTFRERLLYAATVGVGTTALLFTLSRGSWLALIIAVASEMTTTRRAMGNPNPSF